jgi:ABC-type Fe3+ transport system substrate-binding protein
MTTQADFTPEEWASLVQAPFNVAMLITVASPSLFGSITEAYSAAKTLTGMAKSAAPDQLLGAIFATYQNQDAMKEAQPHYETKDPHALRQQIVVNVRKAAAVADAKATPAEAKSFREWLYQFGVQQANSSKEGGFLGIGAVRVNEAEKNALAELASALGVNPAEPPAA